MYETTLDFIFPQLRLLAHPTSTLLQLLISRAFRRSSSYSMAYESIREQLDALMGANRNGDQDPSRRPPTDFLDDRTCKYYLEGFCPHTLFSNTKADMGPCPKFHSDDLKAQYRDRTGSRGHPTVIREMEALCRQMISELDKRVQKSLRRLMVQYGVDDDSRLIIKDPDTNARLKMGDDDYGNEDSDDHEDRRRDEDPVSHDKRGKATAVPGAPVVDDEVEEGELQDGATAIRVKQPPTVVKVISTNGGATTTAQSDEATKPQTVTHGLIKVISNAYIAPLGIKIKSIEGTENANEKDKETKNANGSTIQEDKIEEKETRDTISAGSKEAGSTPATSLPSESESDLPPGVDPSDLPPGVEPVSNATAQEKPQTQALQEKPDTNGKQDSTQKTDDPGVVQKETEQGKKSPEWELQTAPDGEIFYYNKVTQISTWDRPEGVVITGENKDGNAEENPREAMNGNPEDPLADRKKKLRVCEQCAAFLSVFDSEKRLDDHFRGKMHVGYVKLRKKLEDIEEQRRYNHGLRNHRDRDDRYSERDRDYRRSDRSYRDDRPNRSYRTDRPARGRDFRGNRSSYRDHDRRRYSRSDSSDDGSRDRRKDYHRRDRDRDDVRDKNRHRRHSRDRSDKRRRSRSGSHSPQRSSDRRHKYRR